MGRAVQESAVAVGGIAGLAFGNLDRAAAARDADIRLPILLYPTCLPEPAPFLERHDFMPTVSTVEEVAAWSRQAKSLAVYLKLDAGYTDAQIASCLAAFDAIASAGIGAPIRMVSSSAIILSSPEADLNAPAGRTAVRASSRSRSLDRQRFNLI